MSIADFRSQSDPDMAAKPVPDCLQKLVSFLGGLNERAPMGELNRLLNDLDVCDQRLVDFACFEPCTYRRNLIAEGEWYELLCICWQSGQRSPIHNHSGSTCGLRIIQGVATETVFESTPCGQIKAVSSTDFEAGFVCTSQDSDIHQVSNLQAASSDLMTLHIYSPPLKSMDTYSLLGPESIEYTPPALEEE